MKIFNMDDTSWYAAETVEDALKAMAEDQGASLAGIPEHLRAETARSWMADGFPRELSDADLDRLKFIDLDEDDMPTETTQTFREHLAEMVAVGETFPCFFASTEN